MLMIRKVVVIKEWYVDESIEEIREEVHYLYLYDSPISQGQNYYSPQLLLTTIITHHNYYSSPYQYRSLITQEFGVIVTCFRSIETHTH